MATRDDQAYRDALHAESLRLFPGNSADAKKARKGWRNTQRVEAGFKKEGRGGLAGAYDRNKKWVAPVAAGLAALATGGLAAPMAVGALARGLDREGKGGVGIDLGDAARGAVEGAAAGSLTNAGVGAVQGARLGMGGGLRGMAQGAASGAFPALARGDAMLNAPMAIGGDGQGMGGMVQRGVDWLRADGGRNALGVAQGINAAFNTANARRLQNQATRQMEQEFARNAPLRIQGRETMLRGIAGNPFAPVAL